MSDARKRARNAAMARHGVGTAAAGPKRDKKRQLHAYVATAPEQSPAGRMASVPSRILLGKVDAPAAGDHSPSIKSINTLPDRRVGISGRGSGKAGYDRSFSQRAVPTLQLNTTDFGTPRSAVEGSAAHTVYTSMREMGGAGEKHSLQTLDELLDTTRHSYSPYTDAGEPDAGTVRLHRVNVHAENKGGPVLHRSTRGVGPLVAQSMINIWYRGGGRMPALTGRENPVAATSPASKRARDEVGSPMGPAAKRANVAAPARPKRPLTRSADRSAKRSKR